jgi:hypothetical protein
MTSAVPRWVRVVTVAAVSVVAAVAAIVSYVHMHELAHRAGEEWRANIIPLSADGLLVAASMVMLVRRRAGEKAGALAWVGLVLGLVASLGANLAVADWTDPVSIAVSGWPPLALAVAFELLIVVTRDGRAAATGDAGDAPVVGDDAPAPAGEPVGEQAAVSPTSDTRRRPPRSTSTRPRRRPVTPIAPTRAAELIEGGAGRRALARELSITEHQARALLDEHRAPQEGSEPAQIAVNGRSPDGAVR